jgi:hypothetical protein
MSTLKKLKSFVALMFVCTLLAFATLSSCEQKAKDDEDTEQSAGDGEEKKDHPKGEHPKNDSDTTKVEETNP